MIQKLIREHEAFRCYTLNLIPSENIVSDAVKKALASDLASRYASRPEFYGGTKYIQRIWSRTEELASTVFKAKHVNVMPISGHLADLIVVGNLCKPGDRVCAVPMDAGGYPGFARQGSIIDLMNLKPMYLPFSEEDFNVDLDESISLIEKRKPRLLMLGASLILFPQPVRALAKSMHEYGGYVAYDGSHVLGLIAGKQFQDPLREGADLLLGSTHKTFFGPMGGLILSNREDLMEKIDQGVSHRFLDNPHLNRIAALGVALEECRRYGKRYAKQIISNAKALASALEQLRQPVKRTRKGLTMSHQVYLDFGGYKRGAQVRDRLEKAGIIVDSGVRLGTNEVTRRGMREREMKTVAELMVEALTQRPDKVAQRVRRLMRAYRRTRFC